MNKKIDIGIGGLLLALVASLVFFFGVAVAVAVGVGVGVASDMNGA